MKNFENEKGMEEVIKVTMVQHLKDAFKIYGLEGTEDAIIRVYGKETKICEEYLKVYQELIWKI